MIVADLIVPWGGPPGYTRRATWIAALAFLTTLGHAAAADPALRFTDVTPQSGVDFRHTLGDDRMSNIVEATGVGCAWLDFDGDGWLDIYLVNGMHLDDVNDPRTPGRDALRSATDRLYRNRGDGTFEDVTQQAGILPGGYGMGVTVADYDNDGRVDLYVTNYGPNRLYHNLGAGRFEEIAERAGVADPAFGVGATFIDLDNDGWLDLFVGNYLDYTPDFNTPDSFPGPTAYRGQINRLFRNTGNGRFEDRTHASGLGDYPSLTMGVGIVDFNEDGLFDLFVANDAMENMFFENLGGLKFQENALLINVAYGVNGDARGAMGAEVGDVNGDGKFDLFVPDFTFTCLYMNQGDGFFEDQSRQAGLAAACGRYVSWGAALVDLDLDTDLDLYVATGDARKLEGHPDLVFVNDGKGTFTDVSQAAGIAALAPRVSRGVVAGDMDNDGDLDLLVASVNDRPVLLRNDTPRADRHSLLVELVGQTGRSNRNGIGAIVTCEIAEPTGKTKKLLRQHNASGSYLSVHDPRLHFGLGRANTVAKLTVHWPDGSEQVLRDVGGDRLIRVEQE